MFLSCKLFATHTLFPLPQYGNGLPVVRSESEVLAALREAGFEVVEFRDKVKDGDRPWYVCENLITVIAK